MNLSDPLFYFYRILIFFGFFLLVFASNSINPQVLNCNVITNEFEVVGNLTYCKVITPISIVMKNYPLSIKSNNNVDIDGVAFENQQILYLPDLFPLNLATTFHILIVKNSSLKQVTSNNLKTYKSLEVLDLSENYLTYLEKDLLQHNLKLKYFDINSNKIIAIHSTVFESLRKLSYLNILYNKCASQNTFPNQYTIIHGMTNLKTLCMNDCFLQLSQSNNTIEKAKCENFKLSKENKKLSSKMSVFEAVTIITLCCVIAALILYIIYKNCRKSSNDRFHSKVSEKIDMFEETSSICFSSTAGGLDDYPVRVNASNLNGNQSTFAEDGLPENLISEYAEPVFLTKEDIQKRQQNASNYQNSDVNPSHNAPGYLNCGQFSDGSDVKYQNYPLGRSNDNLNDLGVYSTLNVKDVGKRNQNSGQRSAEYGILKGVSTASIGPG